MELDIVREQSKEDGKGQESIQSSNTYAKDTVWYGKVTKNNNKKTSHTREPRGQPFPNR